MAHTLKGWTAIRYAEKHDEFDGELRKYADPVEDAREGLSVSQAKRVAHEDPRLIYLRVPSGKRNPKQPHRRVRKALKKYVKSELGLPTQYTPAKVRVNPKGGLDIKFARPPQGKTRNPRGFSVKANRNPDQEFLIEFNSGGGWRNAGTVYASSAKEAKRVFKQQGSSHAYDGMKLRVRRA